MGRIMGDNTDKTTNLKDIFNDVVDNNSDFDAKKDAIYKDKVELQYDKLQKRQKENKKIKDLDLISQAKKNVKKIQEESTSYINATKKRKMFLNRQFSLAVPYGPKNVILMGAKTGDGKSSIGCNICYHELLQSGRPMYISNEENAGDVFNRVTCLFRKWAYLNHDKFTDEQNAIFEKSIATLSSRMTVIDNNFDSDIPHLTTSPEGVQSVFDSVLKMEYPPTVIILDYYQNISHSTTDPKMVPWQAQDKFAKMLDQYKNRLPCPVIVLAQMKPQAKDSTDFKHRIEGRITIYNTCTCAIEIRADREGLRTELIFHKNRFSESIGTSLFVGFDRGRFVEYSDNWVAQSKLKRLKKEEQKMMKYITKAKPEEEPEDEGEE